MYNVYMYMVVYVLLYNSGVGHSGHDTATYMYMYMYTEQALTNALVAMVVGTAGPVAAAAREVEHAGLPLVTTGIPSTRCRGV